MAHESKRRARFVEAGVSAALLLALMVLVFAGYSGQGTEGGASPGVPSTAGTPLPEDATAGQFVAAAVGWIEAADCQAVKTDLSPHVSAWSYRQGGTAVVGHGGSVVMTGDRLYVAIGGETGLVAPRSKASLPRAKGAMTSRAAFMNDALSKEHRLSIELFSRAERRREEE